MSAKITATDAAKFLGITVQAVHKRLKKNSSEFSKSQNRVYFGHKTAKQLFNNNFTQKIISFQIVKGGTGKTSLAYSIAVRANLYGAKILCVDLDQQGNLSQCFGVNAEEHPCMIDILTENMPIEDAIVSVEDGIDLIPSRIENAILDNTIMLKSHPIDRVFRDRLNPLRKKYDLIIIDCPPAIGHSVAAAALASDFVIAPVTPEKFCLSGLKITNEEVNDLERKYKTKIGLKLVLNKHDSRTTLSHEVLTELIKHPEFGEMLYKTYIRISQEFANAVANNTSIYDSLKNGPAKEDIDLLTQEILGSSLEQVKHESDGVFLGSLENTTSTTASL